MDQICRVKAEWEVGEWGSRGGGGGARPFYERCSQCTFSDTIRRGHELASFECFNAYQRNEGAAGL